MAVNLDIILPKCDAVRAEIEAPSHRPGRRANDLSAGARGESSRCARPSALGVWLVRAAKPIAEVYYTDGDSANAERSRSYLRRAKVGEKVRILVGDAIEPIDDVAGEFDLFLLRWRSNSTPRLFGKRYPV